MSIHILLLSFFVVGVMVIEFAEGGKSTAWYAGVRTTEEGRKVEGGAKSILQHFFILHFRNISSKLDDRHD